MLKARKNNKMKSSSPLNQRKRRKKKRLLVMSLRNSLMSMYIVSEGNSPVSYKNFYHKSQTISSSKPTMSIQIKNVLSKGLLVCNL